MESLDLKQNLYLFLLNVQKCLVNYKFISKYFLNQMINPLISELLRVVIYKI